MANNYVQFSFAIPLDTSEKIEWATRAVAFLTEANEADTLDRLMAIAEHDDESGDPAAMPHEFDALLPEDFVDTESLGFICAVDEDGIWIYTEESGTPDNVVPLAQAFLLKFDPKGCVAFEWADTCSRPRLDEFGGGAVFITATSVEYTNTGSWVTQKIKEHESA